MTEPNKRWIQSLENRQIELLDLKPEQVGSIEEIAHALAGKFRFTCQTRQRYSVAEHAVRGSQLLPAAFAGAFLLHELSEVYLPDIAGPLKPFVKVSVPKFGGDFLNWEDLERQHTRTILEALGLLSIEPLIYSPEIKRMDWAMLAAEKRDLCGPEPEDWKLPEPPPPGVIINTVWSPDTAGHAFVTRFTELFR